MPSYDKEKLLRMMQERRVGFLASRDLMERQGDLRKRVDHMIRVIRDNAYSCGAVDYAESLLKKTVEEAMRLSREQVETYRAENQTRSGPVEKEYATGISYSTWGEFNQLRSRYERVSSEIERNSALMDERYAILPRLKDAVIDWGFNNPDHEL